MAKTKKKEETPSRFDLLVGDWIDEKCPECRAQLLGNLNGDKWCSQLHCMYRKPSDNAQ